MTTTPSDTAAPMPKGFHRDDLFHVLIDALDALDGDCQGYSGSDTVDTPWGKYGRGLDDPGIDPKVTEAGYVAVVAMARQWCHDAIARGSVKPPGRLDLATDDGTVWVLVESAPGDPVTHLEVFEERPTFGVRPDQRIFEGNINGGDSIEITSTYTEEHP